MRRGHAPAQVPAFAQHRDKTAAGGVGVGVVDLLQMLGAPGVQRRGLLAVQVV
jgi:hypothetical protein